eukprot:gnl/MRDRNA2_/MRDRNA2_192579_c0_seq1.p1 gnl/MRDRNA2_/MRDRNA2_192579_c0~~gnl/MRDRNA2_/MRDRNA2_192579_c0_seq1.p1  ORF type:complete len:415 (+),score=68.45 gnl/MRDRNA2_/MRDRNA2_192579_c0_seq1:169-1245(+)
MAHPEEGHLFRVAHIVVVRLHSGSRKVLVETKQTFDDGRTRSRNVLPGMLRRPHEDCRATAKRVLSDELNIPPEVVASVVEFEICEEEHLDEEHESTSYPGIRSIYQKHFIDCFFETHDKKIKGLIGLPSHSDFNTKKEKVQLEWSWWTLEECKRKKVVVQGEKPEYASEKSPFARQEGTWTEQVLVDLLKSKNIPIDQYGKGEAKSIKEFLEELEQGLSYIMRSRDRILRVVDLVTVRIHAQDGSLLVETQENFQDGRNRKRNILPGRKRRPTEDAWQTAKRILFEVNLDPSNIDIVLGNETWDEKESSTYPNIKTVYRKHVMDAFMPADERDVRRASGAVFANASQMRRRRESCFV